MIKRYESGAGDDNGDRSRSPPISGDDADAELHIDPIMEMEGWNDGLSTEASMRLASAFMASVAQLRFMCEDCGRESGDDREEALCMSDTVPHRSMSSAEMPLVSDEEEILVEEPLLREVDDTDTPLALDAPRISSPLSASSMRSASSP